MSAEISYGKWQIGVYRTYAKPLEGIAPILESPFMGRENVLFAAEVGVEVFGDNFMPAYTEGDNRDVVATDTMKNFVLKQALEFDGATLEEFAYFLGDKFLATYQQMQRLRITAQEKPFEAARVPGEHGGVFTDSGVLFGKSHNSHAVAVVEVGRDGDATRVTGHRCGLVGLQLIKITGSSFASFARDEYTTLPERTDRPLFIYLDVFWKYGDTAQMIEPKHEYYVAIEQVRDLVQVTFHRFNSMSIQHLVHEIGLGLLGRFSQIAEVSFEAQNRLWDMEFASEESGANKQVPTVYTDPRPPYGLIRLTLNREQL